MRTKQRGGEGRKQFWALANNSMSPCDLGRQALCLNSLQGGVLVAGSLLWRRPAAAVLLVVGGQAWAWAQLNIPGSRQDHLYPSPGGEGEREAQPCTESSRSVLRKALCLHSASNFCSLPDVLETAPFNREYVELQLQSGGGVILEDFNESQVRNPGHSLCGWVGGEGCQMSFGTALSSSSPPLLVDVQLSASSTALWLERGPWVVSAAEQLYLPAENQFVLQLTRAATITCVVGSQW